MRSAIRWLVGVGIVVAVIGAWRYRPLAWAPRPAAEIAVGDSSELIVGEPIRFKNLTIFPVTSIVPKDQDRFITLAEGLKSGLVSISEIGVQPGSVAIRPAGDGPLAGDSAAEDSPANDPFDATGLAGGPLEAQADPVDPFADNSSETAATDAANAPADGPASGSASPPANSLVGMGSTIGPVQLDANGPGDGEVMLTSFDVDGDVNQLLVTNSSDRPLYLMPGEILVGGKQDRTVADELVVAPHTERMPIQVFCVEHGRWSPRSSEESAALALSLSDSPATEDTPPQSAAGAAFSQAGGYLNKKCRLTVQASKEQSAVWDEVQSVNAMTCPTTGSGAFTANYADAEVTGKLEPYVAAMEKAIADRPQVVGVIVAVNGEIQAADTFESTPLFRKLWPNLLKSYVLDAVAQGGNGPDQAPACDVAQAKAFLRDAIEAKVAASADRDGMVTTHGDAQTVACFSLHESSSRIAGSINGTGDEEDMIRMRGGMGGGMGGGMMRGYGGGMGAQANAPAGNGFGSGVHSAAYSK